VEAGEEDIRRPEDAVDRALPGSIAVIEEMLGVGVVDGDDRVGQDSLAAMLLKRMTPVVVSSVPPMISRIRARRRE